MKSINYWLMKTEPSAFSIDDLAQKGFTEWDGVRNFQVRNMLRDEMQEGDLALLYHSSIKPPGVAGVCRVCSEARPDPTQWDESSQYYDKKASPDKPIWFLVEVEFVEKFSHLVALNELKKHPQLQHMHILRKGNRLSITSVTHTEFTFICSLAHQERPSDKELIKQRS